MILFQSVKDPTRMPDAIVRQIENKILLNELKPGSVLPSETELMKQFGVSRNSVREALRMLEGAGVIKVKQGARGGATVTTLTNEFISDFLFKAFRLGGIAGESISQFRIALEPSIAEMLATTDVDPKLISQMERNIAEAQELCDANKITGYKNMEFHVLLALATGNPMFIIIMNTLRSSLDMISPILHVRHATRTDSIQYHKKILKAIKHHDAAKARVYMHRHLIQVREVVKDVDFKASTRKGDGNEPDRNPR
jgi:GntR family transcriptional regulator, transcriptional repressor for pyruvate dehydrogenase complex